MKYKVIDTETNALVNPDRVWLVVTKDQDGKYDVYYDLTKRKDERERFLRDCETLWQAGGLLIGHNLLGYDWPVLRSTIQVADPANLDLLVDTLVISKAVDYSRDGHSIEDYGLEFGFEKIKFTDFSKFSPEMEPYCKRDVDICEKVFLKYKKYYSNSEHKTSINTEGKFQLKVVNALQDNGFYFNTIKAQKLLDKVCEELAILDKDILEAFPERLRLVREIHPKETKYGTLSKTDFRWLKDPSDLALFNGGPFCRCSWESFNPSSHKQIISVLSEAGWRPVDKTKSHIEIEREYNKVNNQRTRGLDSERQTLYTRLLELRKTGWKVNEQNISSLPLTEPLELWKRKCRLKISHEDCNGLETITNAIKNLKEKKQESITIKIQELTKTDSLKEFMGLILLNLKDCTQNNPDCVKFATSQNHLWSIIVTSQAVFVDCSASFVTDTWVGLRDTNNLQRLISQIKAAQLLAKRIMYEARRRTLTEWLSLVTPEGRIHGRFYGIGAWTHRMAHQSPNTANIPNEFDTFGKKKLLGKELRSLWCAPKNRLLVGCDAEGIQLRIFAHLINEPEFTEALVKGKKDDKTDPHSLNQRILGSVCKSRAAAKRFIYALLLGGGLAKLAEILGCSEAEAKEALDRLLVRYTGWRTLREEVFPKDARRGWFVGLDGRKVRIPSDTEGGRKHLAMSGYLQSGEAVCMKLASLKFIDRLKDYDAKLVNLVHDEWQVECPNNVAVAMEIGRLMADSLTKVGEELQLHCPLAGSIYNDDLKDYTIGTSWAVTH